MKQVSIVFYWGDLGPQMIFFVRHECHKVFFQPAAFTNIKWHIFYNSLLTYICLLKPCYRQMYWIRDNILTLTTHSYFDYSSGYIFVTRFLSSQPSYKIVCISLFTNLNHQIVNRNGIVSSTIDIYGDAIRNLLSNFYAHSQCQECYDL